MVPRSKICFFLPVVHTLVHVGDLHTIACRSQLGVLSKTRRVQTWHSTTAAATDSKREVLRVQHLFALCVMSSSAQVVWLYTEFGLEIPALILHLSVFVCVAVQLKIKVPEFASSFFVLYLWQSSVEIVLCILVRL